MSKHKFIILFTLLSSLLLFGLSHQIQPQSVSSQTLPSPTPIPAPATNTPIPANTPTGGGNNTPQPGPTATPTLIPASTFAPTPEDGYLPTAAPCEDSPTIQAFNNLNVRQGPGTDYEIITRMVFLEVRPIIGRSQYDKWWLIQLADGTSGWVADATGLAQGYIANVPIIEAPPINGETPTPGAPWQPTPRPTCTVTPTSTPSSTPTETPTPRPTVTATATAVPPTSTPTHTPTSLNTETSSNDEAAAATRIASQAIAQVTTATPAPTAYPSQPTALPLEEEPPANTPSLLPLVGLVLIAGGIFVAIARRQFSKQ